MRQEEHHVFFFTPWLSTDPWIKMVAPPVVIQHDYFVSDHSPFFSAYGSHGAE
jgi:hypothetical protein